MPFVVLQWGKQSASVVNISHDVGVERAVVHFEIGYALTVCWEPDDYKHETALLTRHYSQNAEVDEAKILGARASEAAIIAQIATARRNALDERDMMDVRTF